MSYEVIRLFGGSQHWTRQAVRKENGSLPPWLRFAKPRDYDADMLFKHPSDYVMDVTFDEEEYYPQRMMSQTWTKNYNLVYKVATFYTLRGYKLRGMDFSVLTTDLNHEAEWKFEESGGQWWWDLTASQRSHAIAERQGKAWVGPVELIGAPHGPAYSEEFEKSFDNMIT
jgi:hypothetical protein